MSGAAAKTGIAAGLTVITLDLVMVVPHTVTVQVSVTLPPQASGMVLKVEVAVPLIRHPPLKPLV